MLLKISFVTKLSLFFTYIPPVLKVFVIKKNAQGCFDLKSFAAQKKKRKVSENCYNRLSWNFTTRRKTYCFVWVFFSRVILWFMRENSRKQKTEIHLKPPVLFKNYLKIKIFNQFFLYKKGTLSTEFLS